MSLLNIEKLTEELYNCELLELQEIIKEKIIKAIINDENTFTIDTKNYNNFKKRLLITKQKELGIKLINVDNLTYRGTTYAIWEKYAFRNIKQEEQKQLEENKKQEIEQQKNEKETKKNISIFITIMFIMVMYLAKIYL